MKNSKLKTKEIITIVLMSLVNIFIFGFSSLLYFNPFTILLMPVYFALTQGIVYFMLGVKVPKKGTIFLYCVIQSIVTFNIPYILCYLIAGVLAEVILAKMGYACTKSLTISYIVIQVFNCLGSTIYPYAITLKSTLEKMPENGGVSAEYIERAGNMIRSYGSVLLLVAVMLTALLGAFFGSLVVKKHLMQAKTKHNEGEN